MSVQPKIVPTDQVEPYLAKSDLTAEQRKIASICLRKLGSALQIELPFVYVEKDGKRYYTLSGKQGAVVVNVVVITDIPK